MIQRAQLARLSLAVVSFYLPYFSNALASECNRGPLILNTQSDLDVLQKCARTKTDSWETFKGDIIIGPNITGTFTLADYGKVEGSVIAENNTDLESIIVKYGYNGSDTNMGLGVIQGITARNLPKLKSFTYRHDVGMGSDIIFQNLPVLEDLDLGSLLYFTNSRLELVDLPRLKFFRPNDSLTAVGDVKIYNVGLTSIDQFFYLSDDNRKGSNNTYHARGLPNVYNLNLGLTKADSVEIEGNGQLAVFFRCMFCDNSISMFQLHMFFPNLMVSGLSELSRYSYRGMTTESDSNLQQVGSIRLGNFRAANNNFISLALDFEDLGALHVVDNPKLETLLFRHNVAAHYNWTDIVITGNPLLKLNSSISMSDENWRQPLGPGLIWPARDVSSMVFEGSFDNAFFQPFIDLGTDGSKRPHVLKKFSVTSSQPFNCSQLNELRKSGVLKGEYSCQGQTVADESGAARVFGLGSGVGLTIATILWGL